MYNMHSPTYSMFTAVINLPIVTVYCLSRAVLEDLAHGPCPVCSSVRCDDSGQHLPGGFCLQERQVCSQTQVRSINTLLCISPS